MQKYDIHVCLVSAQAAPNLLPTFDIQFKPSEVILLVSDKMKTKATHIERVLKEKKIKVSSRILSDVFNFESMESEIISLVEEYEGNNIALNVTGGTKLMAVAAQNAFMYAGKPIFYIDTDENRIIFITKDNFQKFIPEQALEVKISISEYLTAYGAKVLSESNPNDNKKWMGIMEKFVLEQKKYKSLIPVLNKHCTIAENNKFFSEYTKNNPKTYEVDQFFKELSNGGIIAYDGKKINFRDKHITSFLGGGWLEDFTYLQLKAISYLNDIKCNLDVANEKYNIDKNMYAKENIGNKNEFDITFLAKNKLHIIECKTQLMGKSGGLKADDVLYKLETLKDYGGLMTKKCLVTYFEVPDSVQNRAKTLQIKIIQGKDLMRLKQLIQEWVAR